MVSFHSNVGVVAVAEQPERQLVGGYEQCPEKSVESGVTGVHHQENVRGAAHVDRLFENLPIKDKIAARAAAKSGCYGE